MSKQRVIVIQGPTASGKSALAEAVCKKIGGVIISCDSMQIYKGMDIGTAKPTAADREAIEYRMIDIAEPSCEFSCADFAKRAEAEIADVAASGRWAVLCGGTGLYIDNILYKTEFSPASSDEGYRSSLEGESNDSLHMMLREVDPASADAIHKNNRKRVIRALEIYHLTGKTKSLWDSLSRIKQSPYQPIKITLTSSDRAFLYDRINRRVDIMMSEGLLDEARGIDLDCCNTAAQAIAYKELGGYFRGEKTLCEAVESLKQATRNYAKRQITWFSKNCEGLVIDISRLSFDEQLKLSLEYIEEQISGTN